MAKTGRLGITPTGKGIRIILKNDHKTNLTMKQEEKRAKRNNSETKKLVPNVSGDYVSP